MEQWMYRGDTMKARRQRGFGIVGLLVVAVLVLGAISAVGYVYMHRKAVNQQQSAAADTAAPKTQTSPYATTVSAAPAALRAAIIAQNAHDVPACVKNGHLVMPDGTPDDPLVNYDPAGFATAGIGCADGSLGIFAQVSGTWHFLAVSQFVFPCSLLHKYRFPVALLAIDTPPPVECFGSANKIQPYNG